MDGRQATMSDLDFVRVHAIAQLLQQWKLLTVVNTSEEDVGLAMSTLKVIPYAQKHEWKLTPKYQIGIKHFK